MPVDYLCVGHASYDLSLLLDEFPAENSKHETRQLLHAGGGPAANAAFLLSKWGERTAFAGCVGDDHYGHAILAEFQSVDTDTSLLELRPGHLTPVSVIMVNTRTASRTIVNRKAPAPPLQFDPVRLARMKPRVLLFDGHEPEASLAALSQFPNAISILDAGSLRDGTATLASRVAYLVTSERFATQITGISTPRDAITRAKCVSELHRKFPAPGIAVTFGEHGVMAGSAGSVVYLPAHPVRAVDTTAAGDIFHGAFAYAQGRGMTFLKALRFSAFTASLSVTRHGGRGAIPSLSEVQKGFADAQ
jgi:sugar/nucleoside kinase (ribokinase family)